MTVVLLIFAIILTFLLTMVFFGLTVWLVCQRLGNSILVNPERGKTLTDLLVMLTKKPPDKPVKQPLENGVVREQAAK
jgi:hypothetical protein